MMYNFFIVPLKKKLVATLTHDALISSLVSIAL